MSDDENGESESYAIVSGQGIEYASTESIGDIIFQIHGLVHGPKRDLGLLRSLTEDLWSLVAINDDLMASDTLGSLDDLDNLPVGWKADAVEDDDDESE